MIYVTFQVKPSNYCKNLGYTTQRYAIKCENMEQALKRMRDVYSYEGISYLRLNKCGRLKKRTTILTWQN